MPDQAAPMVSVLTTVYNRAHFLEECIQSQQRSKFEDYEHIIVDDASTDDSVAIARRCAAEDSRIKVFVNDQNLGDYPNRNQAAQHATGTYLKYLDADDLHGPWVLHVMVDAMETFPTAGLGIIDRGPNSPTFPLLLSGAEAQDEFYSHRRDMFNRSPLNAIIKRESFVELGGFSGKRMVGDFEMWHHLSRNYDVVIIPDQLTHWRKHDHQEMTAHAEDPIWAFRYLLISRAELSHSRNPMRSETREQHLDFVERRIGRTIVVAIKKHGLRKAQEMRLEAGWSWPQVISAAFS